MRINSIAEGEQVIAAANNSVCIGSGAPWLVNNQANTFMAGFNSDAPTMYISSASGAGSTGNVGIGGSGYSGLTTPNPIEKLEVWNGNVAQTNVDLVANTTATTANSGTNLLGLTAGACPVFGITTNNLGVANTIAGISNSYVQMGLDVNGPVVNWDIQSALSFKVDANTTNCSPTSLLDLGDNLLGMYSMVLYGSAFTSSGSWSTSDKRFKSNITSIGDPLSIIDKLNGKKYSFKQDEFKKYKFPSGYNFGFIAQELLEIVPEAVKQGSDGYYAVNYEMLIPIIVEGIKVQQSQIDSLKKIIQIDSVVSQSKSDVSSDTINKFVSGENKNIHLDMETELELDSLKKESVDQKMEIESLHFKINSQDAEIKSLNNKMDEILNCLLNAKICDSKIIDTTNLILIDDKDIPYLNQNVPNPFSNSTRISYYMPVHSKEGLIQIYNNSGVVVKEYLHLKNGKNEIIYTTEMEVSGVLYYRLIVDNKLISTYKMVSTGSN